VVTGPPVWNALGLGSTALFAATLVYNTRRTGEVVLDGRRFLMRRVYLPPQPSAEWYVVDLLQHHEMAGVALSDLRDALVTTLRAGRWNKRRLRAMTKTYAGRSVAALIHGALKEAKAPGMVWPDGV